MGSKPHGTLTPELKQAVEKAGDEPVRVEDPQTHTIYLVVREDVYRRMHALTAIDHSDPSLYESFRNAVLRKVLLEVGHARDAAVSLRAAPHWFVTSLIETEDGLSPVATLILAVVTP